MPIFPPTTLPPSLPPCFKFKLAGVEIQDLYDPWKFWKESKSCSLTVGKTIKEVEFSLEMNYTWTFFDFSGTRYRGHNPLRGPCKEARFWKLWQLKIKNQNKRHRDHHASSKLSLFLSLSTGLPSTLLGNLGKPRSSMDWSHLRFLAISLPDAGTAVRLRCGYLICFYWSCSLNPLSWLSISCFTLTADLGKFLHVLRLIGLN